MSCLPVISQKVKFELLCTLLLLVAGAVRPSLGRVKKMFYLTSRLTVYERKLRFAIDLLSIQNQ